MGDLSISLDPADQPELVRGRRDLEHHRQHQPRQIAGRRLDRHGGQRGRVLARAKAVAAADSHHVGQRHDLDLDAAGAFPARPLPSRQSRRRHAETGGTALGWDDHGYYEVALDAGSVTLSP